MLIDFVIVKRRIHDGNDKRRQEENSEIHFSQKREKNGFLIHIRRPADAFHLSKKNCLCLILVFSLVGLHI